MRNRKMHHFYELVVAVGLLDALRGGIVLCWYYFGGGEEDSPRPDQR
jgi:D-hexose-6-phosphate mutarotase